MNQSPRFTIVVGLVACMLCIASLANAEVRTLTSEPMEEAAAKPLYLHWFQPLHNGSGRVPLRHILTSRITPSTDFAIVVSRNQDKETSHSGQDDANAAQVVASAAASTTSQREYRIEGRVDVSNFGSGLATRDEYVVNIEAESRVGEKFESHVSIDREVVGTMEWWRDSLVPTRLIFSRERSPKKVLAARNGLITSKANEDSNEEADDKVAAKSSGNIAKVSTVEEAKSLPDEAGSVIIDARIRSYNAKETGANLIAILEALAQKPRVHELVIHDIWSTHSGVDVLKKFKTLKFITYSGSAVAANPLFDGLAQVSGLERLRLNLHCTRLDQDHCRAAVARMQNISDIQLRMTDTGSPRQHEYKSVYVDIVPNRFRGRSQEKIARTIDVRVSRLCKKLSKEFQSDAVVIVKANQLKDSTTALLLEVRGDADSTRASKIVREIHACLIELERSYFVLTGEQLDSDVYNRTAALASQLE